MISFLLICLGIIIGLLLGCAIFDESAKIKEIEKADSILERRNDRLETRNDRLERKNDMLERINSRLEEAKSRLEKESRRRREEYGCRNSLFKNAFISARVLVKYNKGSSLVIGEIIERIDTNEDAYFKVFYTENGEEKTKWMRYGEIEVIQEDEMPEGEEDA